MVAVIQKIDLIFQGIVELLSDLYLHPPKTKQDMQYYHVAFGKLVDALDLLKQDLINQDSKEVYGKTSINAGSQESSIPRNIKEE